MNRSDPPADQRAATSHRAHAEAVAAALSAPYSHGAQTISARPGHRTTIESVDVDVRRLDVFRFVIDVASADAGSLAELLAARIDQPAIGNRTWTALGRRAFEAGVPHPSPLSNPEAAQHFLRAHPRDVPAILAQYQQGWDAAADERARKVLGTATTRCTESARGDGRRSDDPGVCC